MMKNMTKAYYPSYIKKGGVFMRVVYMGNENINCYKKGETYEVLDIIIVQGEEYYLTENNNKEETYYKSKLFKKVKEV